MAILSLLFREILYRPLLNALIFLYNVIPIHDLGIAIIVLTLVIRFLLYPLSKKAIESQKAVSLLQPKIKEIQKKFKNDKEAQTKAVMEFYRKNKINPLGGCLPLLIQLPIFIALYRVFIGGLTPESLGALYPFIQSPGSINTTFLGLIDLSVKGYIPFAILAGALQFIQGKMMQRTMPKKGAKGDMGSMMGQQMIYLMPIVTVYIAMVVPAALALYWVVITLFAIFQQWLILKKNPKSETPASPAGGLNPK